MAESFKFELVSPEKLLLSVDAEMVTIPGTEGDMGILVEHAPVMTTLRPGIVDVKLADGSEQSFFVAGGFADATPSSLTVLAEFGIPKSELTAEIFAERKRLAQEAHDLIVDDAEKKANAYTYLEQLSHLEQSGLTV
jgi:F-type H+-transporting ATPase subunit epsilon